MDGKTHDSRTKTHNSMRTEIPVYLYELPNCSTQQCMCKLQQATPESARSGKRLIRPAVNGITAAV